MGGRAPDPSRHRAPLESRPSVTCARPQRWIAAWRVFNFLSGAGLRPQSAPGRRPIAPTSASSSTAAASGSLRRRPRPPRAQALLKIATESYRVTGNATSSPSPSGAGRKRSTAPASTRAHASLRRLFRGHVRAAPAHLGRGFAGRPFIVHATGRLPLHPPYESREGSLRVDPPRRRRRCFARSHAGRDHVARGFVVARYCKLLPGLTSKRMPRPAWEWRSTQSASTLTGTF